jgi:RNA polymerase sigma-70 factor, ECF subfamily
MDQTTAAEIVDRVLKGDRQSYALLIDAYKGPLFNLALRMTGSYSDADDLTQEIFIKAYRQLNKFDQKQKYFTWLYTIGINLIRNHLKKKTRENTYCAEDPFGARSSDCGDKTGEGCLILEENLIKLDANMRKLSVEVRESILLKFFQNLTFDEVAAITGDSTGAVKMRIYRGLKQLKQMMEDENI